MTLYNQNRTRFKIVVWNSRSGKHTAEAAAHSKDQYTDGMSLEKLLRLFDERVVIARAFLEESDEPA